MAKDRAWKSSEICLVTHLVHASHDGAFLDGIAEAMGIERRDAWLVVTLFEELGYVRSTIVQRESTDKSAVLYRVTAKGAEALRLQE